MKSEFKSREDRKDPKQSQTRISCNVDVARHCRHCRSFLQHEKRDFPSIFQSFWNSKHLNGNSTHFDTPKCYVSYRRQLTPCTLRTCSCCYRITNLCSPKDCTMYMPLRRKVGRTQANKHQRREKYENMKLALSLLRSQHHHHHERLNATRTRMWPLRFGRRRRQTHPGPAGLCYLVMLLLVLGWATTSMMPVVTVYATFWSSASYIAGERFSLERRRKKLASLV